MANKKTSELNPVENIESGSIFPIVQDGETKQATVQSIRELETPLSASSLNVTGPNSGPLSNLSSGYSSTGAFVGKSVDNSYVWEPGIGISYDTNDVAKGKFKVFSLNKTLHEAIDNPYWADPAPIGTFDVNGNFTNEKTGIGLFQGAHLPTLKDGIESLIDYTYKYDVLNTITRNAIPNSSDFSTFTNPGLNVTLEGDLKEPTLTIPDGGVIQILAEVTPGIEYSTSIKAKRVDGFDLPKYSLIDKNTGIRIGDINEYDSNLSTSDFTEINTVFTAPEDCYQVVFKIAFNPNNPSGDTHKIILTEPSIFSTNYLGSYIETSTGASTIPNSNTSHNTTYDDDYGGAQTGYEGSTGRIMLNGLQVGDQLRVRFDFNVIPQVNNTTIEPAIWYSNRDPNDNITFASPLTNQPVFYGENVAGKTFLNRPEMSAWITSEEDINALILPAIKADNRVIIQPLSLVITIIR